MKTVAVIMAGGSGERFWPKSRNAKPKQFLSLTGDGETMLQKTVNRIMPFISLEDIYILTKSDYRSLVCEQIEGISDDNIITEPVSRNTAPCIALAAAIIRKKYGDAVMVVLPSDHMIKIAPMFTDAVSAAVSVALESQSLVTIGVTPTYPETGYGYINFIPDPAGRQGVYKVKRFVEKPGIELANEYCASGEYLWNSGMFVWKASSICMNINKYMPELYEGVSILAEKYGTDEYDSELERIYPHFISVSIDFGVMEKATDVYTIPGSFGWDDVGSWTAFERINKTNELGNLTVGDVITVDTKNSTVCGGQKLIALVGMENVIVVDTPDAMLICSKDSAQAVKKVIENLKICNRNELL